MVTGRAPSIVHIAISNAPVSDPGTMPMRWPAGSCSIARIRSIAIGEALLAQPLRCERPRTRVSSLAGVQPGGLAQGPDEK